MSHINPGRKKRTKILSSDDRFRSYLIEKLKERSHNLEQKGYDVNWANRILEGHGITKDITQLVSLGSELRVLPFLGMKASHGERIDFLTSEENVEVWTPISVSPQKKLVRFINIIAKTLEIEKRCLHQIIYSPWEAPNVVRYEKSYLQKGPVELVVEILFDIRGFQSEVGKHFMKEIRRRIREKFRKESKRGCILVDISHLSVVDPSSLYNHISKSMTAKDAEYLNGVCLMVMDPYDAEGKKKLILIPNLQANIPLSVDAFTKGIFIEPFEVSFAYALPLITNTKSEGSHQFLERTNEGAFVINGQEVAPSFAAEGTVAIIGLIEKPRKLKSITFKIDKTRITIPF